MQFKTAEIPVEVILQAYPLPLPPIPSPHPLIPTPSPPTASPHPPHPFTSPHLTPIPSSPPPPPLTPHPPSPHPLADLSSSLEDISAGWAGSGGSQNMSSAEGLAEPIGRGLGKRANPIHCGLLSSSPGCTLTPPPQSSGSECWPGDTCSNAYQHSLTASGRWPVAAGYENARYNSRMMGGAQVMAEPITRVCSLMEGGGPSNTKTGLIR